MANMDCPEKEKYKKKDGTCCDRCPPGKFLDQDCNDRNGTICKPCPEGSYTDEQNHLKKCIPCRTCNKNALKVSNCTAKENTVCQCMPGFFCSDDKCDHCEPWTKCSVGKGLIHKPSHKTNTVCTPCTEGTFSNVTDFDSPCKSHFRCEDYGLQLKTPGTSTTDAICEKCNSHCTWILPAGLWAGLVLTILIVGAFIFWRAKRRSYRPGKLSVPVTMVAIGPETILAPPELLAHCQESCNECKPPPFTSDGPPIIRSVSDSLDDSVPITPLKVSFAEPHQISGSTICPSSNFFRSYSEPQEDEWCGT
ncbi:tumor necrosis factor receptor superfamily member 5 [Anableps anableps]